MITCRDFQLIQLTNAAYLLPFGQETAQLQNSIELNDTGVLLWEGLQKGHGKEELCQDILKAYALPSSSQNEVMQDVMQFLSDLKKAKVIQTDNELTSDPSFTTGYMKIGPLTISCHGPQKLFTNYFHDFLCEPCDSMQHITISYARPELPQNGTVLIRRDDIIIMENDQNFILLCPTTPDFYEMHITKDYRRVSLFCSNDTDIETLFHLLRTPILCLSQQKNCFFLHSASLLFEDKAWLFSGVSGTGKSTHTNLWHEIYHTPLLNGDLNMLGLENDNLVVYGQPWCGTSNIYTPRQYPLGGVVFLKQAPNNHCETLPLSQKELFLTLRLISPAWTRDMLKKNTAFAKKICKRLPMFQLMCTPEASACHIMHDAITKNHL